MTARRSWIAGLVGVALAASGARAQIPGLPGAADSAPPAADAFSSPLGAGAAPGVGGAAGAAPKTIWGFFGISQANCQACLAKLCQSQVGLAANRLITGPVSGFTGGFIPPLCPPAPSPAAIAAMPGGPQGAEAVAAKIKQSEADAKARVAAVEYLGTVDCTHWPEATLALKNALRVDPNECVRFAAARVLNSGCCCSKVIIDALTASVSGGDKDGNPPETSPRVKAAAFAALQNCLMRVPADLPPETTPPPLRPEIGPEALPPEPPLSPERPTASLHGQDSSHLKTAHIAPAPRSPSNEDRLRHTTFAQTADEARRTLFEVARNPQPSPILPPGKRSVYHALIKARRDQGDKARTNATSAPGPNDPGVGQTSYSTTLPPTRGGSTSKMPPVPATFLPAQDPGNVGHGEPSAEAKRGLVGLLMKSRNRPAGQ